MRFKSVKQFCLLIIVLAVCFACGYHFESLNPPLPQNAKTITIAPIKNDTFHSSLETRVNRYLYLALQKNQSVVISYEKEADLVLYIHLKKLQIKKTSSDLGQTISSEWNLIGDIRLDKQHQMLWQKQDVMIRNDLSYDAYQGMTTPRGVNDIAKRFAKHVYEQVFVNF